MSTRRPGSSSRRAGSPDSTRSMTSFPKLRQSVVSFPGDDGPPSPAPSPAPLQQRRVATSLPAGPKSASKTNMKTLTTKLRMSVVGSPSMPAVADENEAEKPGRRLRLSKSIGALRNPMGRAAAEAEGAAGTLTKGKGKATERESRTLRERFSTTSLRRSAVAPSPPTSPPSFGQRSPTSPQKRRESTVRQQRPVTRPSSSKPARTAPISPSALLEPRQERSPFFTPSPDQVPSPVIPSEPLSPTSPASQLEYLQRPSPNTLPHSTRDTNQPASGGSADHATPPLTSSSSISARSSGSDLASAQALAPSSSQPNRRPSSRLETKTVDLRNTRRRSYFPSPLASPDLLALSDAEPSLPDSAAVIGLGLARRPSPVPHQPLSASSSSSDAHELALAKLEGRQIPTVDSPDDAASTTSRASSGSPPRRSSLLDASTSSTRAGQRAPYAPRPLLLPAYSNAQRRSAGLPPLTALGPVRPTPGSGAVRISPTKPAPFRHPLYGTGRRLQLQQARAIEAAKQEEKRRKKQEKEDELRQLMRMNRRSGVMNRSANGEDEDAWTWVDSDEGSAGEEDDEVGELRRKRMSRWHGDDLDGDAAVVWRASLDVGRLIGPNGRALGRSRPLLRQAQLAASTTARPSSSLSSVSSRSNDSQTAVRSTGKSSTGSVIDQRLARAAASSSSSALAANTGFQTLLTKIWIAWKTWSPRQRARALFSYGILGGMLGGLVMAAVKAQLGLASGLSPVTIAFFPTLARGAANPTTTGLDRSAGFFFGVGLFLRGGR